MQILDGNDSEVRIELIDSQKWQHYIENEIGFVLPLSQHRWMNNAINATAQSNQLSVDELWELVHQDSRLRQQLLDATLILESRFFRHLPSLEYVTELAKQYQDNLANDDSGQPFRIWSVGCSRGQEAWSLAMMLQQQDIVQYEILGSDVSLQAIKTAQQAQYNAREKQSIAPLYYDYLEDVADDMATDDLQGDWQVTDTLRNKVSFKYHNVFTSTLPTPVKHHVVICQNMLIYFRQFDQRDILARLAAQCVLGGHLILAPGEALFWRHPKMKRLAHKQVNVWQKIAD